MLETAIYLVTKEIALRCGLIDSRYRVADGRFVLNNRDLARVRFTPDEYINGLAGVEKITHDEAKTLIRQNKYRLGYDVKEEENANEITTTDEVATTEQEQVEQENDKNNEVNETIEIEEE